MNSTMVITDQGTTYGIDGIPKTFNPITLFIILLLTIIALGIYMYVIQREKAIKYDTIKNNFRKGWK